MRKILSVVLVVVMLAALITVFPVSAAVTTPPLVITEVCPDTTGWSGHGSDTTDTFEFIEIYNPSTTAVNLYDYSMVISIDVAAGDVGKNPTSTKFFRVNPIVAKGQSVYNTAGTVSTANYPENQYHLYPTNPETAILQPGKTAVIWFFGPDAIKSSVGKGSAVTIDDFKAYFGMDRYSEAALNDILILAVDGNGGAPTATATPIYTPTGSITEAQNVGGVNGAAADAYNLSARFNLYNSATRMYGIISNSAMDTKLKAGTTLANFTMADCISYVFCNYATAEVTKSLVYKTTSEVGQPATGSLADVTYNFITSNNKIDLCFEGTGKAAGIVKYMGLDRYQYATPGMLLPSQVHNFTLANAATYDLNANFTEPSANIRYVRNIKTDTSYVSRVSYTAYEQNFYGMADSTDSDAILASLGWTKSLALNNGGTARYSIEDGKLIVNNLNQGISTSSSDSIITICPAVQGAKISQDNFTVEYELTYLDAEETARYAGVTYFFNDICSYDIFILRVNGAGNNQRRIGGSTYVTYDNRDAILYAANTDTVEGMTSIINKITNGVEKVVATSSTDISGMTAAQRAQQALLLGRTLNVRLEVSQVSGPKYYINGVLVTEATTNDSGVALSPYWGLQTEIGAFSFGLFVSQRVKIAIDNIKIYGYNEGYIADDANDKLKDIAAAILVEPATGDATIYVAVAMTVSFISLAALVVVKRRKNEN